MIFAVSTTAYTDIYPIFSLIDNLTFHSFNLASSSANDSCEIIYLKCFSRLTKPVVKILIYTSVTIGKRSLPQLGSGHCHTSHPGLAPRSSCQWFSNVRGSGLVQEGVSSTLILYSGQCLFWLLWAHSLTVLLPQNTQGVCFGGF